MQLGGAVTSHDLVHPKAKIHGRFALHDLLRRLGSQAPLKLVSLSYSYLYGEPRLNSRSLCCKDTRSDDLQVLELFAGVAVPRKPCAVVEGLPCGCWFQKLLQFLVDRFPVAPSPIH